VPIGRLLDAVRRDLDVTPEAVDGRLDDAWAAVAGPAAAHSRVRTLRGGVLTVVADSPAWASRLRHQERPLLEALASCLGGSAAHRLRVVVRSR
jgi:predicted nucleic acid-binding Zn ribbon protein